jgi:DNA-binding NarL/FixJ family response regulator
MSRRKRTKDRHRILIVDDHPMMRHGLEQLLEREPDLQTVAQAGTAAEALDIVAKRVPDLVLVDLSLPDKNGIELIKDLRSLHSSLRILAISMHDEALYAERALRAGAHGYLMKKEGGAELLRAIRRVLSGEIYLSEPMSAKVLDSFSGHHSHLRSPMEQLSDREFEIFQLLGQGLGTREIAEQLRLSLKTVEVHRANMRRKLALRTGRELVRLAIRWAEVQKVG